MKRGNWTCLLWGFLFSMITSMALFAQSTAQMSGAVTDQSGAVLPGVEVSATQTETGFSRNVVTNETGLYTLTNLPVGPYRLEAGLPGFRTFAQTGIVLQVGSNTVIKVRLEVGQVSETVEVQADAALVETRSTGIGQVIDNVRVLELPLNGRNVQELIILSGAAIGGGTMSTPRYYPTDIISVGGGLQDGLTYQLDGGTHNDPYGNTNLPLPFPDALQEFKVETSAVPAQYGQHSAGAVNAVTKSGTNQFHGSLFEFVRNKVFNARNTFAAARNGMKRNQFGGVIGGPIVTNKLFFFAGHQVTIQRSEPTTVISFVPTPQMMAGDWTAIASPACNQGRQITLRAPFVNNRIDPAVYSKPAVNLVTQWLPSPTDACGKVAVGRRSDSDEHLSVGRIDYQWSEKHSLFGRYTVARLDSPNDYDGKNAISASEPDYIRRAHSFVLGDTFSFSPNVVSSFRGTLLRTVNDKGLLIDLFSFQDLGVKMPYYPPGRTKQVRLSVSGAFAVDMSAPGVTNNTIFQFADDVSLIRGTHQIGFGANFIHSNMNYLQGSWSSGRFAFGATNTGHSLGDLMLGRPNQFRQSQIGTQYLRQNYLGLYLQDTWKVSSNLTLNGGVRWEPYLWPYEKSAPMAFFDKKWFDQGLRSTVFKNGPAGVLFPGDAGAPDIGFSQNPRRWLHFGPRVGFAWDPKGNGLTAVRAAYGLFFDYPHLNQFTGLRESPPRSVLVQLANPIGGFEDPWQGYPGGNPLPVAINANVTFPPSSAYTVFPVSLKTPHVNQWNLSVQKQLGSDWLVAGNYVGSSVIHMLAPEQLNPVIYDPRGSCVIAGRAYTPCSTVANINQRRVLFSQEPTQGQFYEGVSRIGDSGTRSYNALALSVQRRRSRGVTIQGNYSWSHCIEDGAAAIPERRGLSRQNCVLDRRQNFNMSTVYETPQFANAALLVLGTGWRISSIVRLLSGSQLGVTTGLDSLGISPTGMDDRPRQILASPYAETKSVQQWLNPAAFAQPVLGTYGPLIQTANVTGPGSIRVDMGLTRAFRVKEGQSLEFRAEAFNVPNHVNPENPNTILTDPSFGRILSAGSERIMQLALKYVF